MSIGNLNVSRGTFWKKYTLCINYTESIILYVVFVFTKIGIFCENIKNLGSKWRF